MPAVDGAGGRGLRKDARYSAAQRGSLYRPSAHRAGVGPLRHFGTGPYPTPGHAHGLAFSVRPGVGIPRSLQNMYRELESDLNLPRPESGSLTGWAEQGVLLLNNVLTVYEGAANSHKGWGWERFTARLLLTLRQEPRPIAFLLWGKNAQTKGREAAILTSVYPRLVLETAHPSPLSARRGFFGSRPHSRVNAFLEANGQKAIDWQRV